MFKYIKNMFMFLMLCSTASAFGQMASVSGTVATPEGTPINQVTIATSDGSYSTTTDAQGNYSLTLPTSTSYALTFTRNTDYKEDVSFRDIVTMRKHILAMLQLPNNDLILAGDVNNDGNITTVDLILLTRLLIEDTEPDSNSWFIYDESFNQGITIDNLQSDITDLDMTGVKRGNLDCH